MKTKLTLGIIKEGKKHLLDGSLCIGAILFSNALKEEGVIKDPDIRWGSSSGFYVNGRLQSGLYTSYVNGEPKGMMDYRSISFLTYIRLLFSPITVEFSKLRPKY